MEELVQRPQRQARAYSLDCPGPHQDLEVKDAGEKGKGLFATEDLKRGTCVGCYLGLIISDAYSKGYSHDSSSYCMEFKHSGMIIDAFTQGTIVRFANHSTHPNAEIQWEVHGGAFHPALRLKRLVQAGEEICFNYGRKYWARETPLP